MAKALASRVLGTTSLGSLSVARLVAMGGILVVGSFASSASAQSPGVHPPPPAGSMPVGGGVAREIASHPPSRAMLDEAIAHYKRDPASAQARPPESLSTFFGHPVKSANVDSLKVELIKAAGPGGQETSVPFLHTQAGDEGRHNDAFVFHLVDSLNPTFNPFPHAAVVPRDGSTLIRLWSNYRSLKDGPPPELTGTALRREIARISIWSYVMGNVDGPAVNLSNGGFALVLESDGTTSWRGVVIDGQFAMDPNEHWGDGHGTVPPWKTASRVWDVEVHNWLEPGTKKGILGLGPVEQIPEGVAESLRKLAENASRRDLATRAGMDPTRDEDLQKMAAVRTRAQEVLTHYRIAWKAN
jgi:hypothetical protein